MARRGTEVAAGGAGREGAGPAGRPRKAASCGEGKAHRCPSSLPSQDATGSLRPALPGLRLRPWAGGRQAGRGVRLQAKVSGLYSNGRGAPGPHSPRQTRRRNSSTCMTRSGRQPPRALCGAEPPLQGQSRSPPQPPNGSLSSPSFPPALGELSFHRIPPLFLSQVDQMGAEPSQEGREAPGRDAPRRTGG